MPSLLESGIEITRGNDAGLHGSASRGEPHADDLIEVAALQRANFQEHIHIRRMEMETSGLISGDERRSERWGRKGGSGVEKGGG